MTKQSPTGRYQVFSAMNYHTRYPNITPAARYDLLRDAISHADSVTYRMAVVDELAESRGFIYTNWGRIATAYSVTTQADQDAGNSPVTIEADTPEAAAAKYEVRACDYFCDDKSHVGEPETIIVEDEGGNVTRIKTTYA
jgi:hypothetical protein